MSYSDLSPLVYGPLLVLHVIMYAAASKQKLVNRDKADAFPYMSANQNFIAGTGDNYLN